MSDKPADKPQTINWKERSLAWSFRYAARGIAQAFASERNMKIHGAFAIAALLACVILQVGPYGWALIIGCIVAVFAAECVNTALESLVDLVTDEYAPLARIAKDCAAAAVLIAAAGAVVIGLIVYIPAFLSLVGS